MSMMTKAELVEAAYEMTGGSVKDFTLKKLRQLMTVTQFVTDLALNEIECRGELTYTKESSQLIVPYQCDFMLETILTRASGPHQSGRLTNVEGAYRKGTGFDRFEHFLNIAREALEEENPNMTDDELEKMFLTWAGF